MGLLCCRCWKRIREGYEGFRIVLDDWVGIRC